MPSFLLNQAGVNTVWFACILGAAFGFDWIGTLCALAWVSWVLYAHSDWRLELRLLLCAGAIGFIADLAQISFGGISYTSHPPGLPGPLWIVALWMSFATSLNVSLSWLLGRLGVAAAMGAICGPLAYIAGRRFGAVSFGLPDIESLAVIGVVWAIAFCLLVFVATRMQVGKPAILHVESAN